MKHLATLALIALLATSAVAGPKWNNNQNDNNNRDAGRAHQPVGGPGKGHR